MKALNEIKDEVCQEMGYSSFSDYIEELIDVGSIYTVERISKLTEEICKRYAIEVSKESLKNASERVVMKKGERRPPSGQIDYIGSHYQIIDRESILSDSNLPDL